jgi:uncharacterized protein (TIGR02996 family)
VTDRADLLAAILANPDDDTVRLVYADYLQEHGDEDRAEFIRVQIELARGPDGIDCERMDGAGGRYDCLPVGASLPKIGETVTARCGGSRWTVFTGRVYAWFEASDGRRGFSLTHVTGSTWEPELTRRECELWAVIPSKQFLLGLVPNMCWRTDRDEPLRERQCGWIVRRGFIDEAKLTAADWLAHADAILAEHPVRRVRLTTPAAVLGPSFNSLRDWKKPLLAGASALWSFEAEWPGIVFEEPQYRGLVIEVTQDMITGAPFPIT